MAKQGQHKNDAHDRPKSKGHNNPSKSVTVTTGTPKKQEIYRQQALQHKDTAPVPQAAKNTWNEDTRDRPETGGSAGAQHPRARRSGSESNADRATQGY